MAYSTNDDFNVIKKNAVLLPLRGSSWNKLDSFLLNKLNKYKITILLIIILSYINLIIKYLKKKI